MRQRTAVTSLGNRAEHVSRRSFLGASLGALALASGCRTLSTSSPAVTVATLTQQNPFYIAHRGGAGDWPEMTAYGYEQAATLPGLQAMSISVCRTADGVLVCSSDTTTKRLTGRDLTILKEDWSTLSQLTVTASQTTNPRQPRRPFARFDDVIDAHIDRFVFFVEPQVSEAAGNLMAKLISMDQPERIVWKQPITSSRFAEAKRHGFATWAYVLDEPAHTGHNLVRLAASDTIDMLGTSRARADAFISKVAMAAASNQKKMIGWDVKDDQDRARLLKLGCNGIASSTIREILADPLPARESPPAER